MFCCKGSWEQYFGSVSRQNNNSNPKTSLRLLVKGTRPLYSVIQ